MKKILLVEDDAHLCAMLSKMLKFEGIDTVIAGDGSIAQEILEEIGDTIDVILCDVMMPNVSGYEFLAHIKHTVKFANIPFIFLSACVSKEEESHGCALGARAFLKKPVDIFTLLSALCSSNES
ncbi:MAG: response regulator [Puniceicoccales bacterium]|jgi:CheY-like chemotaxis protein|nr:response regulator [Puniceicoccales bacterium]